MFSPLKLTGPRALKALVKVDAVERFPMLRGMVSFVENNKHAMHCKDEQVGAQCLVHTGSPIMETAGLKVAQNQPGIAP